MRLIELKSIRKEYPINNGQDVFVALDDINLSIEEGEYVAIVGPSGSGKSTLLQILGMLDHPSSGEYFFNGKNVLKASDKILTHIRSKSIGFIFQMFNLLPRVTASENVMLPMIYRGKKNLEHVKFLLTQLGMKDHINHTPGQMSGGQQQRVAIARALSNKPHIVFADEPTGNLPQKQSHEIIKELERQHSKGLTLVIITHSTDISQRADRVVRIVDGKIVEDTKHDANIKKSKQAGNGSTKNEVTKLEGDFAKRKINFGLLGQICKMSLQSLLRNKVRTFLTMLGIIIGVFAVISMLAIGNGAKKSVQDELKVIGSNMFRVRSEWPKVKGTVSHKRSIIHLNKKDLEALKKYENTKSINRVAATTEGKVIATNKGYSYTSRLFGSSPNFQGMRGLDMLSGRFYSKSENNNEERVCVLGYTVFEQLFPNKTNPVGQFILINQRKYRVVGLLARKGSSWVEDLDDIIYVPVETALKRIFGSKHYAFFFVDAVTDDQLSNAVNTVENILRQSHRLNESAGNDFAIKNYGEIRQTLNSISKNFIILIIIIAFISLLVGGIGIMNIMLVSVTERTREIGVRKAIGANKSDILNQFLIESVLISVLGGLIGVSLAYLAGSVVSYYLQWDIIYESYMILVAVGFSFTVGVFFGWYPAKRAANLSPIQALRYE